MLKSWVAAQGIKQRLDLEIDEVGITKLAAQTAKSDSSRDELSHIREFTEAERDDRSR
jgi:hypothetical protein